MTTFKRDFKFDVNIMERIPKKKRTCRKKFCRFKTKSWI